MKPEQFPSYRVYTTALLNSLFRLVHRCSVIFWIAARVALIHSLPYVTIFFIVAAVMEDAPHKHILMMFEVCFFFFFFLRESPLSGKL